MPSDLAKKKAAKKKEAAKARQRVKKHEEVNEEAEQPDGKENGAVTNREANGGVFHLVATHYCKNNDVTGTVLTKENFGQ